MNPQPGGRGRRNKSDKPHPVDVHVGSRLRLRRTLLGMSQEKLGHAIGLTFQQVQKYERGANRIGASRLYELSRVLDVPVTFFFDALDPALVGGMSAATPRLRSRQGDRQCLYGAGSPALSRGAASPLATCPADHDAASDDGRGRCRARTTRLWPTPRAQAAAVAARADGDAVAAPASGAAGARRAHAAYAVPVHGRDDLARDRLWRRRASGGAGGGASRDRAAGGRGL